MVDDICSTDRASATSIVLAQLEVGMVLSALFAVDLKANNRPRASDLKAMTQRMLAWATRIDAQSDEGTEARLVPSVAYYLPFPTILAIAQRLNIIGPVAGRLRPLPVATDWLTMSSSAQSYALQNTISTMASLGGSSPVARLLRLALDHQVHQEITEKAPSSRPLQLEPDLTLRDSIETRLGARLAISPWAEWVEPGACLRLTKASVARASSAALTVGEDPAGRLVSLLTAIAEPALNRSQLLQLQGWCVSEATTGHHRVRRQQAPCLQDDTGAQAWRLAALCLMEAIARWVPEVPSPPHEAFLGLEDTASANAATGDRVAAWLKAIHSAKGVEGVPIGVDAHWLDTVESALALSEDLYMRYRTDTAAESWRQITPLRLDWHRGRLLLVAHCHLRGAERSFRMDRVLELRPANGWPADAGRPL